jgi:hypothetical protein
MVDCNQGNIIFNPIVIDMMDMQRAIWCSFAQKNIKLLSARSLLQLDRQKLNQALALRFKESQHDGSKKSLCLNDKHIPRNTKLEP